MNELNLKLKKLETEYSGKDFRAVVDTVKKERISDNELLTQIENVSHRRFVDKVSFTLSIPAGNLLACFVTVAALILAFVTGSNLLLYMCALILLATLHPLSHYVTGSLLGIRFTHFYLDGPARFEPTLRIDYASYLRASPAKRATMHASGVIGTVIAPLIVAFIALNKGDVGAAFYLFIFFLLLIVFELLTSTKNGDLMRARREYGYR